MKRLCAGLLLGVSIQAPVWAAHNYSGRELLADLKDSQGIGMLSSLNYLAGIAAAEAFARTNEKSRPYSRPYFCSPDRVTTTQLGDVVKQFLEADAQAGDFPAVYPVRWALLKAFPCPDNP